MAGHIFFRHLTLAAGILLGTASYAQAPVGNNGNSLNKPGVSIEDIGWIDPFHTDSAIKKTTNCA